jgi:hypothetical protein
MLNSIRQTRITRLGILLLVLGLLLSSPMTRVVGDSGESSSNFQVSASGSEAQIASHIDSSGIEKQYQAQITTSDGVRIHIHFNSETNTSENEIEFQASFLRLVEFTDPSGTFTNTSTILQSIDLSQLNYSPVSESQVTYNAVKGYELVTQGVQGNFTFKVVAYAFPNSTNVNTTSISPSSLKIIIYIINFPYKQSNSLLALQLDTQSDRSIETSNANTQSEVESSDSGLGEQAVFSWNGPLTVNGQPYTGGVKSSITSIGDEDKTLNLIYPHGASIVHDPIIGLVLGATTPLYLEPTFLLGASVAAVLTVVGLVAITRRKK